MLSLSIVIKTKRERKSYGFHISNIVFVQKFIEIRDLEEFVHTCPLNRFVLFFMSILSLLLSLTRYLEGKRLKESDGNKRHKKGFPPNDLDSSKRILGKRAHPFLS